jgi:hypothetical protein
VGASKITNKGENDFLDAPVAPAVKRTAALPTVTAKSIDT